MNRDQRIAARLAAHHEQMKRYEADGYSRSEASIRAGQDMQIIPAAQASTAALAETDPDEQAYAVDTLARERDRYRAALTEIVDRAPGIARTVARGETPASALARMAAIARRALDQG